MAVFTHFVNGFYFLLELHTFIYLLFSDLLFFVIGYNGAVSIFSLTMLFSTIMSLSQYDNCHSFKGFVKEETPK